MSPYIVGTVVKSEEDGRRNRIAFNSLYLFRFRSIIYKANGKNCMISRVEKNLSALLPQAASRSLCPISFPVPIQKRHGGVASMTRDRGYPDRLILSARLLAQPF